MFALREILGRCRAPARFVAFGLACGLLASVLSGCGQKGPLYLPGEQAKNSQIQPPAR